MIEDSWNWTEEDLLELIELGVQESLQLDYKRSDALQRTDSKKNEISKDVSAFANSAGGTIVYGMTEDGHVPVSLDGGFDPNEISKEWLEQVISSRIQRRISGIRVNQISLTKSAPGRVAYVVHVPQSHHAPHQANDKRFFKRFNFESTPMEEYEVRDVASRSTSPDLSIRFAFQNGDDHLQLTPDDDEYYEVIELVAIVTNGSQQVAEYAVFDIYLDERISLGRLPAEVRHHDRSSSLKMDGVEQQLNRLVILWDNKRGLPIFSGVEAVIPTPPLQVSLPRATSLLALRYTIGSPGMAMRDEYRFISITDDVAKFVIPKVTQVSADESAA